MKLPARMTVSCVLPCLIVIFLVAAIAQDQSAPMPQQPALPATAHENWKVKQFKFSRPTPVYDNWTAERKKIADLPRGEVVSGLDKLHVTYDPDVVTITAPMPAFSLNAGDSIFRYTYYGEGFADFWIKGRWYPMLDGSFITELEGNNGCSKNCSGKVTKAGRFEQWRQIRLLDGRVGWFRAAT